MPQRTCSWSSRDHCRVPSVLLTNREMSRAWNHASDLGTDQLTAPQTVMVGAPLRHWAAQRAESDRSGVGRECTHLPLVVGCRIAGGGGRTMLPGMPARPVLSGVN